MKKNRRILSTLIALVLFCAMTAATAFAAVPSSLTVDGNTENGTINLTKYLVVDKDAPVPAASFSFSLAPETVEEGTETDAGIPVYTGSVVTDGTATVTFTMVILQQTAPLMTVLPMMETRNMRLGQQRSAWQVQVLRNRACTAMVLQRLRKAAQG